METLSNSVCTQELDKRSREIQGASQSRGDENNTKPTNGESDLGLPGHSASMHVYMTCVHIGSVCGAIHLQ